MPLHAASSPESATGKSFLWDVVGAFATGNYCPVMAPGDTEHETDMRIDAQLLSGKPLFSIDNVTKPLGIAKTQSGDRATGGRGASAAHQQDRHRREPRDDPRHRHKLPGEGRSRRTLRCEMDAGMERPETRQFTANPFVEVLRHRDVYIAAALTINRAYRWSGASVDDDVEPLESYSAWTEFVRKPLIWLECDDPKSTEKLRDDDPERAEMLAVFAAWHAAFGDEEMTVAAVVEAVRDKRQNDVDSGVIRRPFDEPLAVTDLRAAIAAATRKKGDIDAAELGY